MNYIFVTIGAEPAQAIIEQPVSRPRHWLRLRRRLSAARWDKRRQVDWNRRRRKLVRERACLPFQIYARRRLKQGSIFLWHQVSAQDEDAVMPVNPHLAP